MLVASNNEGKNKADVIHDDQTSQDPVIPDDQTSPVPVIQDSPDLAVLDQSSSDSVVSDYQASLHVVTLDSKVVDDPSPVIDDDCTSSLVVTSNVHEIQDGVKTDVVQQEVSDLKKSKFISALY